MSGAPLSTEREELLELRRSIKTVLTGQLTAGASADVKSAQLAMVLRDAGYRKVVEAEHSAECRPFELAAAIVQSGQKFGFQVDGERYRVVRAPGDQA